MLHQVNLFVDIQRLQRMQQLVVAHLVDQVAPDVFRGLQQHFAAFIVCTSATARYARHRERFQRIGEIRRRQMRDQHLDFRQIVGQRAVIIAFSQRQFAQQRGGHRFIGAQSQIRRARSSSRNLALFYAKRTSIGQSF
jgi:hypothetical protein